MKLSEDSPIVSIAEQISEVIIAGFLWLIACIPIITIGPASAALYYTIVKVVRKKHSTVTIAFWHSFKGKFKAGNWYNTILSGICRNFTTSRLGMNAHFFL